uniref:Retrotransposon gag domain-containing protein n=1 Tax=Ananas comosus var. bracteatus TaxID=296719 RepID=A0A6V7Q9H8_ANACO|nr:unnamed protein product [Ananas comosus var. bracteatus]
MAPNFAEGYVGGRQRNIGMTMPITRSQSAGVDNAANFEQVETSATSGSSEVRGGGTTADRRGAPTGGADEASGGPTMQQAAASRETQALHRQHQLWTLHRERRPRAQFFACGACGRTPGGGLGSTTCAEAPGWSGIPYLGRGAERDRLMERLNEFRRCSPRVFDGEKVDHWIVEKWLMHMEKHFRDTFVEERDRVWLATHHLDGEAYRWWLDLQENPHRLGSYHLDEVQGASSGALLPTSVKRKMELHLRSLRQGDRTVAEYEREFSRLLHCVPFIVRDDEDKARIFERGLRPSIFRFVQSLTSKPTGRWWIARSLWRAARRMSRNSERLETKGRPRGLRLRVRARRTLGGRRSILGASSVDATQQRIEEDPIGAGLPDVGFPTSLGGGLEHIAYAADCEYCMPRDYPGCGIPEVVGWEDLSILHVAYGEHYMPCDG